MLKNSHTIVVNEVSVFLSVFKEYVQWLHINIHVLLGKNVILYLSSKSVDFSTVALHFCNKLGTNCTPFQQRVTPQHNTNTNTHSEYRFMPFLLQVNKQTGSQLSICTKNSMFRLVLSNIQFNTKRASHWWCIAWEPEALP